MKRVILLRSNPVNPDPPVEKAALALLNAGYDVKIIGWDRDTDDAIKKDFVQLSDYKVEVIRFGVKAQFSGGIKKNLLPLCIFLKRLQYWLVKNQAMYDVIHAFDFDTGFVASRYAKKFNKKLVYHILDYYVDSHGLRKTVLEKPILELENSVINCADATIICTEKRKEQITGSTPKRLVVIHNTPSVAQFKQCDIKTKQTGRIKIVYVGILEPSRLLKEIVAVVSENNSIEFHVGGFGTLEEFFKDKSHVFDNIYYYGRLPYDQTLSLENECDIMTALYDPDIPNHQFCAPNKLYEAMLLGKPILMCRNTGWDDLITENDIGVLIESNEQGVRSGLEQLLEKRNQWPEMAQRSQKIYHTNYAWPKMEERILQIYQNL